MSELRNILRAIYRKDFSTLERLSHADVNIKDQDGRTPLMHAVLAEDTEPAVVKLLVARGADVNATDAKQKWSPLHFAARDDKEAIVRSLLEAGAAVDAADVFGNTPLWETVMSSTPSPSVARELLKHGADPYRKNNDGVAPIDTARRTGRVELLNLFPERSKN
jgi:ankyrin repeat protein